MAAKFYWHRYGNVTVTLCVVSGTGIQRAAQTVLGVYLKRTCSHVTSASSSLGVLNDYICIFCLPKLVVQTCNIIV